MLQQIISGLKSRSSETKLIAAKRLQLHVSTELREVSVEQSTAFMDDLNHSIFEMISSSDVSEKKGGILAIMGLIGVDEGNATTKMPRFANYLRNLLPNDPTVMEMAARAMGRLALTGGTFTADYVEFELKQALEWLGSERSEAKRHAAVLVLREMALNAPTFFFQQVQPFFDNIFVAVRDPKQAIREGAVEALRACLVILAQRETKQTQKQLCYSQIYDQAKSGFEDTNTKEKGILLSKEDKAHGSLLLINELLRISCIEGERHRQELEETYSDHFEDLTNMDHQLGSSSRKSRGFPQTGNQSQHHLDVAFTSSSINDPHHCHSRICREYLEEKFDELCKLAFKYRNTRNMLIQQTLLVLLPQLASFNPTKFVYKGYLKETMQYLSAAYRREREKSAAFKANGLVILAVRNQRKDIEVLSKVTLEQIRSALPMKDTGHKSKRQVSVDPMVFACISCLARAAGKSIYNPLKELLQPMLSVGLSPALTACLCDLARECNQLKKSIQDGLLKILSQILRSRSTRSSQPKGSSQPATAAGSILSTDQVETANIVLALRTLGSFDFDPHQLTHNKLIRHCSDSFLASENKDIRMEAVRTCSRLLSPSLNPMIIPNAPMQTSPISPALEQLVSEVLEKLLLVGITDEDPDIRFCVLSSLDERFDSHLAQAECLAQLFVALNDEEFEIREVAICTIGRLSGLNPAYIMPTLRKTLIQILTELEYSGVGRNKEQSAKMLGHLVRNAHRLIRPYMIPILKALIPKLQDQDPNVVTSVLSAVGEHAQVCGIEMKRWVDELFPIIIEMLQDASSLAKREIALWTLGQLVESTGYVVEPYQKYPNLLEVLLNFLKTEQASGIRKEAIRVLGLLGALDPYKHKLNQTGGVLIDSGVSKDTGESTDSTDNTTSEMLVNMGSGQLEEFYPLAAIGALMRIMRNPSLSQQHPNVIQAVTFIFNSIGMKCVTYLPQIMPPYLNVIRTCDSALRDYVFQQLGMLISIIKQHVRNYLDEIFTLIKEYWTMDTSLQNTLIPLVETICVAMGGEFKMYLPQIIPQILKVFMHDDSKNRVYTLKLLSAFQKFGSSLDDYLHLMIPPVVKLFDSNDVLVAIRRCALETLEKLCEQLDLTDFVSRIIHAIVRTLDMSPELRVPALATLCALVNQLGKKFMTFIPMVNKVLLKHKIQHKAYDVIVSRIHRESTLSFWEQEPFFGSKKSSHSNAAHGSDSATVLETGFKKLQMSVNSLQRAWSSARCVSKDDWLEWLRRLSLEFLKESPSPPLRSCWSLAQSHPPLARDLLNASFVSCWCELHEEMQNELVKNLEHSLRSQSIPEVTQTLLNLAEFMEHTDIGSLPLSEDLLGQCASKSRAYAKALHYKEQEFHNGLKTETLEALISINNKLQQPEAANGILGYAMKDHGKDIKVKGVKVKERWYEKLHDWENALQAYKKKLEQDPEDIQFTLGKMRCLEALREWGELDKVACRKWPDVSDDTRKDMARMAAAAAWGLGNWESMEEYTCMIPRETQDGAFYRAVLALHQDHFQQAQTCIDAARDVLDTELTARAGESYNRAYGAVVNAQMLSELEEIIQYKLIQERRETIKLTWWNRLQGCQKVVEDWQKILQVRSLVLSPQEDMQSWLKYSSLCRKSGHLALSHKTLVMLLGSDPSKTPDQPLPTTYPQVTFAYMKYMFRSGQKEEAFQNLQHFVQTTLHQQALQSISPQDEQKRQELLKLLARGYLKLGDWQTDLEGFNETTIPQILDYYKAATENDQTWYKAWHQWAFMNFEGVLYHKNRQYLPSDSEDGDPGTPTAQSTNPIITYAVPAVHGFFKSIALSNTGSSLQDTLRLLTLAFDFGQWSKVYGALVEGIKTIEIDTWLHVIPQLIARIDTPRQLVSRLIHQLLTDIGKQHPQALIYPLTVASKSASSARHNAANQILTNMCEHSCVLVQQAMMVSEELIRVAILWHELWHEGLEEASRLYFGEKNVKGMFAVLEPLHLKMERGPQTLKETSFNQAYGRDLMEAQEWCKKYQRSGNVKDLTEAWDLYYHVFRKISKQLPQLTSLELQYVSPKLLMSRDLELAVPGSYEPHKTVIHISHVHSSLNVITSKQRPRKLAITGSNGAEFMFLLKGHEDLRQDERVMQLFGLVNTLLDKDPTTSKRHLSIQRYSVIPLSTNSGLIGWVPHCDTLHELIRDYREKKKILLNIEHRIMLRMAPDYDHLTMMQKVEVFEHALEHTHGDDLAKLLWLKSPSSEVWFDRRTNYTRSLAVMSMVGYVLGLGDRHPSNLMLDRLTGKILHIDFGDCFEVAMTREKFPEKIPFRLTRILINAMEVTGIDGNYRFTCEHVMRVLREHKDSVMAVLEAFVYDPLLNWRLMDAAPKGKKSKGRSDSITESGSDVLESVQGGHEIPNRKTATNLEQLHSMDTGSHEPEALNKKAVSIINRVRDKLTGNDFTNREVLDVQTQVDLLIQQATSHENLCQCYIGWCPFW